MPDGSFDSKLPQMIFLETTTACNLRCSLCPRFVDDYARQGSLMPIEVYDSVRPYFSDLRELALVGCGEPLTDKRLLHFVAEAAGHNVYVMFTTNGTLLNADLNLQIIQSGLGLLGISIDGASRQVFEQIRDGAQFETVVENARDFIQMRNCLGIRPIVKIQVVILKQNLMDLPALVHLAAELGADELYAKNPSIFCENGHSPDSLQETVGSSEDVHQCNEAIAAALQMARACGLRAVFPSYQQQGPSDCPYHPQRQLYIRRDGEVFPCPMYAVTHSVAKCMGNVLNNTLADIWCSPAFQEFRAKFITGREGTCVTCSLWRQGYQVYSPRPIFSYCY